MKYSLYCFALISVFYPLAVLLVRLPAKKALSESERDRPFFFYPAVFIFRASGQDNGKKANGLNQNSPRFSDIIFNFGVAENEQTFDQNIGQHFKMLCVNTVVVAQPIAYHSVKAV